MPRLGLGLGVPEMKVLTEVVPGTDVLDLYPGSIGGFALRTLRTSYTGPIVELQVSGGVDTDDFYDDAGILKNSSSETPTEWLVTLGQPANQGLRVRTLYNQALGATFNIEQTTTSLQPHIYNNGESDYHRIGINNKIAIHWDDTDDALSSTSFAGYNNVSLFVVEELLSTEPAHLLIQGISSTYYRVVAEIGSGSALSNVAGTVYVGGVATGSTTRSQLYADIQGVYNGQAIGGIAAQYIDISMPSSGYSTFHLNKYNSGSFFSNECNIAELIMYPSDMTTDVVAISNEQSLFYGLPDPAPFLNTYSLDFDGVNQYVEAAIDGTATGDFGILSAKEFTISFWLNANQATGVAFNWGDTHSSLYPYVLIYTTTGYITYLMWTGAGVATWVVSTIPYPLGVWGHIALSRTASDNTWRLYINGVADTTIDDTGTTDSKEANAQKVFLGEGVYAATLGNIDEVSMFTTALSQSDITSIYNGGAPNDISSLSPYSWWRMGDGAVYPMINNEQAYSHRSLQFDSITDYVNVPDDASLDLTNTITLSAWIKPSEVNPQWDGIIYKQRGATNGGYYMGMSSSKKLAGGVKDTSNWQTVQGATTLLADVWQHVAVVIDLTAETLKLYLNGVLDGSNTSYAYPITGNNDAVYIGAGSAVGENFQGLIDDCAIFNTALPATGTGSIEEIYNNGSPADISAMSGLVSYWKMGDGDTFPTITDNAGSNDGTMTNMTADDITGAQTTGIMENMVAGDIVADVPEPPPDLPITGLWGHWDAALGITMDGSNLISQWEDQSGNGNHWEQSTGSDQPLFVADAGADLNNLPAVSFAGTYLSPDWMYLTGTGTTFYESGDSGAYTIFLVYTDMNAGPSNLGGVIQGQYDRSPSTDPQYANIMIYKANGNTNTPYIGWSTNGFLGNLSQNGPHIGDINPHIMGSTFHGTFNTNPNQESWGANIDNGTETCYPTLCQGYAAGGTVAVSDYLYLNKQLGYIAPNGLVYKLAEMVLYKGALSNADFNDASIYLKNKYNVY